MAISVEQGLTGRWRSGSNAMLLVSSPDDPGRVRSALDAARPDIAALGPAYQPEPVAVPGGHLLIIDFGTAPAGPFHTVPDLIARHLAGAGITEAFVHTPSRIGDRYSAIGGLGPAARAWLRGRLGAPLGDAPRGADDLLEVAAGWVHDAAPGHSPQGVVVSAELALTWPQVVPALGPALAGQAPVAVVASDFRSEAFVAAVEGSLQGVVKQAMLTAAGADPAAAMRRQRELARAHAATLAWAGVDATPDSGGALSAQWTGRRPGGEHVADLIVPDAMWFQVLSAGHQARLGGLPEGTLPLAGGRVELTVGEPEQWLPGHPDGPAVRARARELLAACLVDERTGMQLAGERLSAARSRDTEGFFGRR